MDFSVVLARRGFRRAEERAGRGTTLYAAHPNRYMTYWVHAFDDGSALFTWEFAVADYLAAHGMQVGADEALNQFMYPREDVRGSQDGAWLTAAIERTEAMLSDLRFDRPAG